MGAILAAAAKAGTATATKTAAKTAAKATAKTALKKGATRQAAKAAASRAATKTYINAAKEPAMAAAQKSAINAATKPADNAISNAIDVLGDTLAHSLMAAGAIVLTTGAIGLTIVDKVQDSGMGFGPWMLGAMGLNVPSFGLSLPGLPNFGLGGNSADIQSPLPGISLQDLIDYEPTFGQSFGPETGNQRSYGAHGGIDFDCSIGGCPGANVAAMMAGTVTATEVIGSSANGASYRLIITANDWKGSVEHRYVHVDSLKVSQGDSVKAGQIIAKVSPTDSVSTGPHLDLKISRNGQWVNPQTYMRDALANMGNQNDGGKTSADPQGIYQGLQRRGMSPLLSAAFVGNIGQESSFDPTVVNSIGAAGLVQWLDGRRQRLDQFAASKGTEWTDVDTQLDFILHELNGSESAAYSKIKAAEATGNLEATVRAIAVHYERMGAHEIKLQNRINYARQVYR